MVRIHSKLNNNNMSDNARWSQLDSIEHSSLAHQICFEAAFRGNIKPTENTIGSCMSYVLRTVRNYAQEIPTISSLRGDSAAGAEAASDE
jgi:hypothetical protein